jgi:hypothetical protein
MQRLATIEKQMLTSPDQQISLTNPDSRSMATSGRGSGVVVYNVQVAVDTTHHLIVTHEVTNVGTDRSQLANVAKKTKTTLEARSLDVVADRGYFSSGQILVCEEAGITVTLPFVEEDGSGSPTPSRLKKTNWSCAATRPTPASAAPSSRAVPPARSGESPDGSMNTFSKPFSGDSMSIREDAPAAQDRRASLRHYQGPDRHNPLLDENAATGGCRDGPALLAYNLTRVMNIMGIQPLMAALRA